MKALVTLRVMPSEIPFSFECDLDLADIPGSVMSLESMDVKLIAVEQMGDTLIVSAEGKADTDIVALLREGFKSGLPVKEIYDDPPASLVPAMPFYSPTGTGISSPKNEGDAGYDLASPKDYSINPMDAVLIDTGVCVQLPHHSVGLLRDRSSMAMKGVYLFGGVIDRSYRGPIKVLLRNLSRRKYDVKAGDRIAQLLVLPVFAPTLIAVAEAELTTTVRGGGGFGSTGA